MTPIDIVMPALGIAASPFGVVPAILLLFSPRPRASAGAFLGGWALGVLGGFLLGALASELMVAREPGLWRGPLLAAVGLVLLALAGRQWRNRHSAEVPAWLDGLAEYAPRNAFRLGLLLSLANPKVLLLAVAGGLAVPEAAYIGPAFVFVALACATVALPLLLHLSAAERVMAPLGRARDWLIRHNGAIVALVLAVIGAKLLTNGLNALIG